MTSIYFPSIKINLWKSKGFLKPSKSGDCYIKHGRFSGNLQKFKRTNFMIKLALDIKNPSEIKKLIKNWFHWFSHKTLKKLASLGEEVDIMWLINAHIILVIRIFAKFLWKIRKTLEIFRKITQFHLNWKSPWKIVNFHWCCENLRNV